MNQPFVDRYLPAGDPIGSQLIIDDADGERMPITIVGVVPHVGVSTEAHDPAESIYLPFAQHPQRGMSLVVRASGATETVAAELPRIGAAVDPDVAFHDALPLDALIREMRRTERTFSVLFIAVGSAALLLAAVGLAGMMAWSVRQRRRELGIRAALGATPLRITWTALRGSIAQLVIGGVVGTALGIEAAKALGTSVLLGIPATDATVLTAVPVVLMIVGALAAWGPARYAAGIPVVDAIRAD